MIIMKVTNEVRVHSINDLDTVVGEERKFKVRNVWNRQKFVELQFNDESKIVVLASELEKAIKNATDNKD